jgi:hypothetical protein
MFHPPIMSQNIRDGLRAPSPNPTAAIVRKSESESTPQKNPNRSLDCKS